MLSSPLCSVRARLALHRKRQLQLLLCYVHMRQVTNWNHVVPRSMGSQQLVVESYLTRTTDLLHGFGRPDIALCTAFCCSCSTSRVVYRSGDADATLLTTGLTSALVLLHDVDDSVTLISTGKKESILKYVSIPT